MQAFLTCSGVVALAEIGDKTQLLALVLATRFKTPLPIILGMLAATLANHVLAALLGVSVSGLLSGDLFKWGLALSFIAMGAWTLVPDKLDASATPPRRGGAFLVTLVAFFLAEIGDKTQVATMALAAQFHDVVWVTLGTTAGMMLANVPVVLAGDAAAARLPLRAIRVVAACAFIALGLATIWDIVK